MLLWFKPAHTYACCCYALLCADTFSPTGSVAFSELEETSQAIEKLCVISGIDYKETLLFGSEGVSSLNFALDSLHPTSEDLVFFVFLGHGYRLEGESSPWPTFFFFHTHESLPMQHLLSRLNALPSKLLCVLADCCNYPLKRGSTFSYLPSCHTKKPRKLLDWGKGHFVISAAQAGSCAYCTERRHCCAAALWRALHEESSQCNPNWEKIGPRIVQLLSPLQTPYYMFDILSEEIEEDSFASTATVSSAPLM